MRKPFNLGKSTGAKQARNADPALDSYVAAAGAEPFLTAEEEWELAKQYHAGNKRAGDRIINSHVKFALKVAHKFRWTGLPLEDLVQEANVALLVTLEKFDPSRGVRFMTYAAWWCRTILARFANANISAAHYPVGTTSKVLSAYMKILDKEPGISPEDASVKVSKAVKKSTGSSISPEVALVVILRGRDLSLNQSVNSSDEAGSITHLDLLADEGPSPEEEAVAREKRQEVATVAQMVTRNFRDRFILNQRLAKGEDGMTLQQVADRYGVSRERIRQIEEALKVRVEAGLMAAGVSP